MRHHGKCSRDRQKPGCIRVEGQLHILFGEAVVEQIFALSAQNSQPFAVFYKYFLGLNVIRQTGQTDFVYCIFKLYQIL